MNYTDLENHMVCPFADDEPLGRLERQSDEDEYDEAVMGIAREIQNRPDKLEDALYDSLIDATHSNVDIQKLMQAVWSKDMKALEPMIAEWSLHFEIQASHSETVDCPLTREIAELGRRQIG